MLDMINRSHTNPKKKNTRKPWKWMLADSLIVGLIATVASMPSTIPSVAECWVMFKAFLGSFIFQVAVERGLKRKK